MKASKQTKNNPNGGRRFGKSAVRLTRALFVATPNGSGDLPSAIAAAAAPIDRRVFFRSNRKEAKYNDCRRRPATAAIGDVCERSEFFADERQAYCRSSRWLLLFLIIKPSERQEPEIRLYAKT